MHRWTSMSLKCPKCFSGIGMMSEHFFMKKQHLKTSCVHFYFFACKQMKKGTQVQEFVPSTMQVHGSGTNVA